LDPGRRASVPIVHLPLIRRYVFCKIDVPLRKRTQKYGFR
jgi:hypothetical protein